KAWSPQRAKRDWRILATTRLLTQVYTFTWDPAIRALIEANTDLFTDAEGDLGLTKDRPYNSSSYKTQVDVACILDAWRALGQRRYYDLAMRLSRFWWGEFLGTWPIFYFNPQGRIGQFLYDETGDPSIPQHLLIQLRQACTAFDLKTGHVTGSASGNIGAHDAAFVMHGIPFAQEVIVRTNVDREPLASWVACDDYGFPVKVVSRKEREGAISLDIRYSSEGGSGSACQGEAGGFVVRPLSEDRAWGMDLNRVEERSGGVVRARVPKDAPAGEYAFIAPSHGFLMAQGRERLPLVLHAPEYWKPAPAMAPAARWYFRVPQGSADSQLFFEGSARLFDPQGKPWPNDKEVSGWVDLPSDKPGLWSFEPARDRLVGSRNLPPFFAANDPASYFEPKIPWSRQPAYRPAPPPKLDKDFVEGAIALPGNQALLLGENKAFRLDAGPARATDGGAYLPFKQGTIEFFIKPGWSSFDLPEDRILTLVRLLTGKEDWTLSCYHYPDSKQWFLTHSLYGYFMTDGPSRRISMRVYRQMVFMPGDWVHVAWVWGPKDVVDFRSGKMMTCASTRLFVNGKEGRFSAYSGGQWRGNTPADEPNALLLLNVAPKLGTAYDELRVSSNQRYTDDFTPPSRDRELALDEHTRALFHFNGNLKGESWGAKEEIKGQLTKR
ncbi:MAG TPA: hypothetical protein P5137_15180, partial [Candidatus Brocadiia bacterium]|nr:hypothetical protein [Candidatus Brocadiia bacterium]